MKAKSLAKSQTVSWRNISISLKMAVQGVSQIACSCHDSNLRCFSGGQGLSQIADCVKDLGIPGSSLRPPPTFLGGEWDRSVPPRVGRA